MACRDESNIFMEIFNLKTERGDVKALLALPLKKNFFCDFPYPNTDIKNWETTGGTLHCLG